MPQRCEAKEVWEIIDDSVGKARNYSKARRYTKQTPVSEAAKYISLDGFRYDRSVVANRYLLGSGMIGLMKLPDSLPPDPKKKEIVLMYAFSKGGRCIKPYPCYLHVTL